MASAFENKKLRKIGAEARYRDPDTVVRPSAVIEELVPEFQKVSGARRMARVLSKKGNRSAQLSDLPERDRKRGRGARRRIPDRRRSLMAITNHDRVSKAMELLKAGLDRCSHAEHCHSLKTACMRFYLLVYMCIDSRALKLRSPYDQPEHLHASP